MNYVNSNNNIDWDASAQRCIHFLFDYTRKCSRNTNNHMVYAYLTNTNIKTYVRIGPLPSDVSKNLLSLNLGYNFLTGKK